MNPELSHRLDGLESDNLLAFLALLGLLRALENEDKNIPQSERWWPRVKWDVDMPPLRPRLFLAKPVTQDEVSEAIARGLDRLALAHQFGDHRVDLNYRHDECRDVLKSEALTSSSNRRDRADLLAAMMSDAAIKDDKKTVAIDPTPLCLLFGQGHQHFLARLASVPREPAPPPRGKGKRAIGLSAAQCLGEAMFQPWHRADPTFSFRWDPEEDVRYALLPGDPTDPAYKSRTQHGANRLAAVGLAALTLVPEQRAGRVRPVVIGGQWTRSGFSMAWPIWGNAATLAAIRALLAHPRLRDPKALRHLGVSQVLVARRISVGKFMNFTRALPIAAA